MAKKVWEHWPGATEEDLARMAEILDHCSPEARQRANEWGKELDGTGESESFDRPFRSGSPMPLQPWAYTGLDGGSFSGSKIEFEVGAGLRFEGDPFKNK